MRQRILQFEKSLFAFCFGGYDFICNRSRFWISTIKGTSKIVGAVDMNTFPIAIVERFFKVGRIITKDFSV
jgi:hypothetical protein